MIGFGVKLNVKNKIEHEQLAQHALCNNATAGLIDIEQCFSSCVVCFTLLDPNIHFSM